MKLLLALYLLFWIMDVEGLRLGHRENVKEEGSWVKYYKDGYKSEKEMEDWLMFYGKNMNLKESCVICEYIMQKILKIVDIDKECVEIPVENNSSSFVEQALEIKTEVRNILEMPRKVNIVSKGINEWKIKYSNEKWNCAERKLSNLIKELCENEISLSFGKYCKPMFDQFYVFINGVLEHGNSWEVCQKMNMCPFMINVI